MMMINTSPNIQLAIQNGYVSGAENGVVTVAGVPSARNIAVLDAVTYALVSIYYSLPNGHYLIGNLDPTKKYLLMCRDLPPDGVSERYEPFCWDYVTPMSDKTLAEQQEMWQQMTEK